MTRTDTSPKKRSESIFAYLNRSGHPGSEASRALIEDWFSRVPVTEQDNFRSGFRSGGDVKFATAFQELCLHELLLNLQCKVHFHPTVTGSAKHPDFRVREPNRSEFLLEARTTTEVSSGPESNPRRDRVLDFLQGFKLDGYSIGISELTTGSKDLRQRTLEKHVRKALEGGDEDDFGHIAIPLLETDDGWRIELTAIRDTSLRTDKDGNVLYQAWSRTWSDPRYPLLNALEKKASRYGDQLSMPFVIAVNSFDYMLTNRDFDTALFGAAPGRKPTRMTDGRVARPFWGTAQTPNRLRVSAVLFTKNLWPETVLMGQVQSSLYLNPWPEWPYEGALTKLDTVRFEDGALRRYSGAPIHELLKLRLERASLWQ